MVAGDVVLAGAEHGADDVAQAAGEAGEDGDVVLSLGAFAVVVGAACARSQRIASRCRTGLRRVRPPRRRARPVVRGRRATSRWRGRGRTRPAPPAADPYEERDELGAGDEPLMTVTPARRGIRPTRRRRGRFRSPGRRRIWSARLRHPPGIVRFDTRKEERAFRLARHHFGNRTGNSTGNRDKLRQVDSGAGLGHPGQLRTRSRAWTRHWPLPYRAPPSGPTAVCVTTRASGGAHRTPAPR